MIGSTLGQITRRIRENITGAILTFGAITDGEYLKRSGSNIVSGNPTAVTGTGNSFTAPPIASAWTQVNFNGSDTLTDITSSEGAALLLQTVYIGATNSLRVAVKSAPSTPYTVTAIFRAPIFLSSTTPHYAGLIFRESGTGKLYAFDITGTIASNPIKAIRILKWTNPTTFSADALAALALSLDTPFICFQQSDDGTNLKFRVSGNMGATWTELLSVGRTSFMAGAPNQIGFHTDPAGGSLGLDLVLYSWAIT